MKKYLLPLALVSVVALQACNQKPPASAGEAAEAPAGEAAKRHPHADNDPWGHCGRLHRRVALQSRLENLDHAGGDANGDWPECDRFRSDFSAMPLPSGESKLSLKMNKLNILTVAVLVAASTMRLALPARAQGQSSTATSAGPEFVPGQPWLDLGGNAVNAHGGGVLSFAGTYYWYGEHKLPGKSEARSESGASITSPTRMAMPAAAAPTTSASTK